MDALWGYRRTVEEGAEERRWRSVYDAGARDLGRR
jgi:hypothetical protein